MNYQIVYELANGVVKKVETNTSPYMEGDVIVVPYITKSGKERNHLLRLDEGLSNIRKVSITSKFWEGEHIYNSHPH